jgi:hypothetical protein
MLTDAPSSYASQNTKPVRVNSGETGLEFYNPPYDIGFTKIGVPTNGEILLKIPLARSVRFQTNMPNSFAKARVATTSATTMTLAKDGSVFATIYWGAGESNGAFTCASNTDFTAGQQLQVTANTFADATIADIGFMFAGIRL